MEDLPLEEQLRRINETDILIGMHGAGLGHILLTPPNSALLELFPCHFAPHYTYTFYMMAAGRRLHYARYIQSFPWREYAGFAFRTKKEREPQNYAFMPGDYSRISPKVILRKIRQLKHRIETRGKDIKKNNE